MRCYDSTINNYLIKLEECNEAIQKPKELREIISQMKDMSNLRQSPIEKQNKSDSSTETRNDQMITFLFLEKMSELEELTKEDKSLTAKFNKEKAEQIADNAALLEEISRRARAGGAVRRSSIFKR